MKKNMWKLDEQKLEGLLHEKVNVMWNVLQAYPCFVQKSWLDAQLQSPKLMCKLGDRKRHMCNKT